MNDGAALKAAFAEAFNGYTNYLYCGEEQLLKLGSDELAVEEFYPEGPER